MYDSGLPTPSYSVSSLGSSPERGLTRVRLAEPHTGIWGGRMPATAGAGWGCSVGFLGWRYLGAPGRQVLAWRQSGPAAPPAVHAGLHSSYPGQGRWHTALPQGRGWAPLALRTRSGWWGASPRVQLRNDGQCARPSQVWINNYGASSGRDSIHTRKLMMHKNSSRRAKCLKHSDKRTSTRAGHTRSGDGAG